MRDTEQGRRALVQALRDEGGSVAACLRDDAGDARPEHRVGSAQSGPEQPGPAQLAAAGPRAAGREADYELLLEMIYEGTLLHYASSRVFETQDPDLCLLLGDRLYAAGLGRLAQIGDLEAVSELADLISLLAQAQARDDPELSHAIWVAGAAAIGWGTSPAHDSGKALARAESPDATDALRKAAAGVGW